MSNYKVIGFNERGRAEVARMILSKSGTPFEDIRFEISEWPGFKEANPSWFPMGQSPNLEVDGYVMWQSMAICQFLGKRFGFYGNNVREETKILAIHMTMDDLVKLPYDVIFLLQNEEEKKYQTGQYQKKLVNHLENLEKLVEGDGYFIGSKITVADIAFFVYSEFFDLIEATYDWKDYPKLNKIISTVRSPLESLRNGLLGKIKLVNHLENLEKLVEGDGYFIGSKITVADMAFFVHSEYFDLLEATYDWKNYPKLCKIVETVKSDPKIAEYLKNRPKTKF